ncbi:DUF3152 domain-containing protein [Streptomyces sp. NPDC059989]|uniref:DUF3152 domain-containing protein n=1 Tax=Streptomyces sp. NPDC059989 TaxID=3347026 RepID=UPI0036AD148F
MGRHSRKDPAPAPAPARPAPEPAPAEPDPLPYERFEAYEPYERFEAFEPYERYEPYGEPRVRSWPEPTVTHQGYVAQDPFLPGGHPEQYEPGGAWGTGADSVYGDWRGVPRTRGAHPAATAPVLDTDTPAFGTPAVGFPQITLDPPAPTPAYIPPAPRRVGRPAPDAVTSTGSHRRVPGPRKPADAAQPVAEPPGSGRGSKVRTYTGMAAAAVTTVLAVVVAVQVVNDRDGAPHGTLAAKDDGRADAAAHRPDGTPTPDGAAAAPSVSAPASAPAPAQEPTYEQKMAQQLPIDAKLTGPGTFDTVPGVAKAPGKGKLVRYRVDVEQGLGLDAQLFAEAVHRTLNDDRSWGHGGTKTFERVPGGEADFVITLASPGTTGAWCAKSGLDTTVDNVSCDSASTDRVMINAFRWAQGSPTYGPDQMFAYRQMLINHEVGHRLGHGHVSCRTPGALAPIMQQQTKSLDVDGIQCKPNPWVFPGS